MNYDFDLDVHYIEFDNFKQKQVAIFRHVLEASRLMFDMKFHSYATITLDPEDTHHLHPHIEETEAFNRLKTNCLVYDMPITDANKGYFDKCFIYQSVGSKGNGFYGYLLYNSETKQLDHVFYIEREEGAICRRLNKTISLMRHRDKYQPYKI